MNANMGSEHIRSRDQAKAIITRAAFVNEDVHAGGRYDICVLRPPEHLRSEYIELRDTIARLDRLPLLGRHLGRSLRRDLREFPLIASDFDHIINTVMTEGRNAKLTNHLKGSAFTQTVFMGLVESTGFSSYNATNTAANITAAGGGSPTNGWNEAQSSQCASRGTPSFGTASGGSLALSAALNFSIIAAVTIKGAFLIVKSAAGTAATATVGNTNGALYSAGNFTGGDKVVGNGDTLSVSYTATLT